MMDGKKTIGWIIDQLEKTMQVSESAMGGTEGPVYVAYSNTYLKLKNMTYHSQDKAAYDNPASFVEAAGIFFKKITPSGEDVQPPHFLKIHNSIFLQACSGLGAEEDKFIDRLITLNQQANEDPEDANECKKGIIQFIMQILDKPATFWFDPEPPRKEDTGENCVGFDVCTDYSSVQPANLQGVPNKVGSPDKSDNWDDQKFSPTDLHIFLNLEDLPMEKQNSTLRSDNSQDTGNAPLSIPEDDGSAVKNNETGSSERSSKSDELGTGSQSVSDSYSAIDSTGAGAQPEPANINLDQQTSDTGNVNGLPTGLDQSKALTTQETLPEIETSNDKQVASGVDSIAPITEPALIDKPTPDPVASPTGPKSPVTLIELNKQPYSVNPPHDLFKQIIKYENPTILFELEISAGVSKVYDCLKTMVMKMPDITGKYNEKKKYEADIGIDSLFTISNFWTNDFFRMNGNTPLDSSTSSANDGKPPIILLARDRLGIQILGYWKGYDGLLSMLFVLKDPREPFLAKFEKEYFIAPNPRDLWKDIDVPNDIIYCVNNVASDGIAIDGGDLIAVAASRRGRSHANVGKPRDDSFNIISDATTGWTAVAVADGAGSSMYSRKGSELACMTSVETFLKNAKELFTDKNQFNNFSELIGKLHADFSNDITIRASDPRLDMTEERMKAKGFSRFILNAVGKAYEAIAEEVTQKIVEQVANAYDSQKNGKEPDRPITIRDYHTTLLFAAFKKFEFGYFIASFWIGDGGLALYNPDNSGKVKILGNPDSGEFAGQTRFLTMAEELQQEKAINRVFFSFPEDFEALLLATDGITDPFFPSEEKINDEREWKKFWDFALKQGADGNPGCPMLFDGSEISKKQDGLLDWLNFWVQGEHDDRTILIVKKHPDNRSVRNRYSHPYANFPDPGDQGDATADSPAPASTLPLEKPENLPDIEEKVYSLDYIVENAAMTGPRLDKQCSLNHEEPQTLAETKSDLPSNEATDSISQNQSSPSQPPTQHTLESKADAVSSDIAEQVQRQYPDKDLQSDQGYSNPNTVLGTGDISPEKHTALDNKQGNEHSDNQSDTDCGHEK
jgi:serine/threonine protein phosphatase PrpC